MNDELDFLAADMGAEAEQVGAYLTRLKDEADNVLELQRACLDMEESLKRLQQDYARRREELAQRMSVYGLTSLETNAGDRLEVVTKCYCSPNKNEQDRQEQIEWLAKYGGEHLVKLEGKIPTDQIIRAKEAGIPVFEVKDINTGSLKAFITDLLGLKGGTAQVGLDDLPPSFHFTVQNELKVN